MIKNIFMLSLSIIFCMSAGNAVTWAPLKNISPDEINNYYKALNDYYAELQKIARENFENYEDEDKEFFCYSPASSSYFMYDRLKEQKPVKYSVFYLGNAEKYKDKLPDPKEAVNAWFQNVLKYRKKYPDFDKIFDDILPLLESGIDMIETKKPKEPFVFPNIDHIKSDRYFNQENFLNTQIEFIKAFRSLDEYLGLQDEDDVKIFFTEGNSLDFCSGFSVVGCRMSPEFLGNNDEYIFVRIPLPKKNFLYYISWLDPLGIYYRISEKINMKKRLKRTLVHEFGHSFGFGDLYEKGKSNTDFKSIGSGIKNGKKGSIMNASMKLTCDDADGIIAMIDKRLGKERTFNSLCMDGSYYINGYYYPSKSKKLQKQFVDKMKSPAIKIPEAFGL